MTHKGALRGPTRSGDKILFGASLIVNKIFILLTYVF